MSLCLFQLIVLVTHHTAPDNKELLTCVVEVVGLT